MQNASNGNHISSPIHPNQINLVPIQKLSNEESAIIRKINDHLDT